jgi:tetratricopeptide (TPR) repeat protein
VSALETIPRIAAKRKIEPKKLANLLRGELDWIVMKCLEKDRTRRYETANGLADDLERYLDDEPVAARPPSRLYAARKFVRRNWRGVMASTAVALVVFTGIVLYVRGIKAERANTLREKLQAERQRELAQHKEQEATAKAATAQAVTAFLADMLASANPNRMLGPNVTVLEAIRTAVKELDRGRLKAQPMVEANVRTTIGNTLSSLAEYDEAVANLQRALEIRRQISPPEDPAIITAEIHLAVTLSAQGSGADAVKLARETLQRARTTRQADDPQLAKVINALGHILHESGGDMLEAEALHREA